MHISVTEKVNISAVYETNRFEVIEGKIFFLALTQFSSQDCNSIEAFLSIS